MGCIVGLAVGDALGYPAEFRTRADVQQALGPAGIQDFVSQKDERFSRPIILGPKHPPGTFTDDTQMSLAVLEGLLEAGERDLEDLMAAVARRFVAWSKSRDNDRAPGETCMTGCHNLEAGVPWRQANVPNSKGCGSAMRVAPIGLYFSGDLQRAMEIARAQSLMTHGHPAALEGAAAAAAMVALALKDTPPDLMHRIIEEQTRGRCRDFDEVWARVPDVIDLPPEEVLVDGVLGEGWVAEEAAASALYCYWRHERSFAECVLSAANTDGDSDSIAAIAGSISGARLGIHAIPERWRDGVEDAGRLHGLGAALSKAARGLGRKWMQ